MAATDDVNAALQGDGLDDHQLLVSYGSTRQGHGGHEGHTSIRNAGHNGHRIEIQTTYRVLVDGKELSGHFGVDQDGTTHYHGLPNYQQASAVDLVKTVIDQFPDDFPGNANGEEEG